MRRVFLGLLPDPAARDQAMRIAGQLVLSRRQRVRVGNYHVTLLFIGALDDERLPALHRRLAAVTGEPFALRFDSLSFWRKPKVLCLTSNQAPPAAALALHDGLAAALQELAIGYDDRPFCPHLTLARHVTQAQQLTITPIIWQASEFALLESLKVDGQTRYQPLCRWRL